MPQTNGEAVAMDISGDGSITLDRRAFKALASETRVEILKRLDGTQKTVSDLARELDMNKATMFQHLEQLVEVGLVKKDSEEDRATTVKEAPNEAPVQGPPKKWVYYRLSWKGRNVLHPERVKIAIMLSLVAVSCLLAVVVYAMAFQGPSPGGPDEKDTLPPMVVDWEVDPVSTASGMISVQVAVADNTTGKVSGLDPDAPAVLRWGVASDGLLPDPDILAWTSIDYTLHGGVIRAQIPAMDWGLRAGKYLVISVGLRDRAGNAASYRFSEKVAPASGPELGIGAVSYDRGVSASPYILFSVRLDNAGPANATNVTLSAYVYDPDARRTGKASSGGTLLATGQAAFVGAGRSETVNMSVNSKYIRSRTFYIMVDPDNALSEANEADNVLASAVPPGFPVRPPPPAKSADAAPGMELGAVALALALAAVLARRRMRGGAIEPDGLRPFQWTR